MHMTGHQAYNEQFRKDPVTGELVSLGNIGCNDFFSFNDQQYVREREKGREGERKRGAGEREKEKRH
jgi:hypothetical protein